LSVEPTQLRFSYGPHGMPNLADEFRKSGLRFSLSQSEDLALLGVTSYRRIGIDIELLRPDFAYKEIAERFFSRQEIVKLLSLPAELRTQAFFNCWTRKEAYIKAGGEGLSLPLDQFEVSFTPEEEPALLSTCPDPTEANRWSLLELHPGDAYAAALAVEASVRLLRGLNWRF